MRTTIYLVCSTVDLGYHAEYGYTSIEKAEAKMAELIELAKERYIKSAMTPSPYNLFPVYEKVVQDADRYHEKYEIASVEIEK
jgi:hypothetical protein